MPDLVSGYLLGFAFGFLSGAPVWRALVRLGLRRKRAHLMRPVNYGGRLQGKTLAVLEDGSIVCEVGGGGAP